MPALGPKVHTQYILLDLKSINVVDIGLLDPQGSIFWSNLA